MTPLVEALGNVDDGEFDTRVLGDTSREQAAWVDVHATSVGAGPTVTRRDSLPWPFAASGARVAASPSWPRSAAGDLVKF
jgi:hypothetical protein